MTVAEWAPIVDISEDDRSYIIKAELSEVKKEDVHVRLENGVVTLTGERKSEKEEKGRKYQVARRRIHCSRKLMQPRSNEPFSGLRGILL